MASIRRRGEKWQAQVRRKGASPLTKSFSLKSDAERWVRDMERGIEARALSVDPRALERHSVRNLIERYRDEVVTLKKAKSVETAILNGFLKSDVADLRLSELGSHHFAKYRDKRLMRVKPATVHRELGLIQHAFEIARREWSLGLTQNPLADVRKPKLCNRRDRRLQEAEERRLIDVAERSRNDYLVPLIQFALETGMRLGEILRIEPQHISRKARTLLISETKNGEPRTIPLSEQALAILDARTPGDEGKHFPCTTNAVKLSWRRTTKLAKIDDLHFHDLRHEAISRFFERGLTVPEVALISGHLDPRMLFRYTHLKAEDLASKL